MKEELINAAALSIRSLTMDAVEDAGSGHPGLPMGLADVGSVLFGEVLKHCAEAPTWPDRDRFVLSAGHGSLLQYCLLYLSGYEVSVQDIANFRKLHAKCAGHPEYGSIPGIETTTGPLGQGVGNAVGMAIAEEMLAAKFNTASHCIVDHYTYVVASDGDLMEGISSEACSLAGHLKLSKLVVLYDDNGTTIDGPTHLSFTEDVGKRFEAYGWHVLSVDAYNGEEVAKGLKLAQEEKDRPSLICVKSLLGKGAPNKQGKSVAHGAPLGSEEVKAAKTNLGLDPDTKYFVHPLASSYYEAVRARGKKQYREWQKSFEDWSVTNPELRDEWDRLFGNETVSGSALTLPDYQVGEMVATRQASGEVTQAIMQYLDGFVGGAADVAASTKTNFTTKPPFGPSDRNAPFINFGVREHSMGAIANGISLHGGFRPFVAAYLVFSDYMRPAIRLSALMGLPVSFVFTHDSIYVGEDGPTHQPVEHITGLRAIPNLLVLRPGDAEETVEAWMMSLKRTEGPTALILSRQKLSVYTKSDTSWRHTIRKGAYVVREGGEKPDVILLATGSEVNLALEAAKESRRNIRVVSVLSRELFLSQSEDFKDSLLPVAVPVVVVEAGIAQGWDRLAKHPGRILSVERYGFSAPGDSVAKEVGFTKNSLLELIDSV